MGSLVFRSGVLVEIRALAARQRSQGSRAFRKSPLAGCKTLASTAAAFADRPRGGIYRFEGWQGDISAEYLACTHRIHAFGLGSPSNTRREYRSIWAHIARPCRTAARKLQLSHWCFKIALALQECKAKLSWRQALREVPRGRRSSKYSTTTGCCWAPPTFSR